MRCNLIAFIIIMNTRTLSPDAKHGNVGLPWTEAGAVLQYLQSWVTVPPYSCSYWEYPVVLFLIKCSFFHLPTIGCGYWVMQLHVDHTRWCICSALLFAFTNVSHCFRRVTFLNEQTAKWLKTAWCSTYIAGTIALIHWQCGGLGSQSITWSCHCNRKIIK